MEAHRNLERLRSMQRWLDRAFRVPGTDFRFGWDPIIGLVPWLGDVVTALLACAIVVHASRLGVPRVVRLRMLLNVAFDLLLGVVPFAGDVADFFWRANDRNMRLLEAHVAAPGRPTTGDWFFVGAVLAVMLACAALPLVALWMLLSALGRPLV